MWRKYTLYNVQLKIDVISTGKIAIWPQKSKIGKVEISLIHIRSVSDICVTVEWTSVLELVSVRIKTSSMQSYVINSS